MTVTALTMAYARTESATASLASPVITANLRSALISAITMDSATKMADATASLASKATLAIN